jgi:hypothetical protein
MARTNEETLFLSLISLGLDIWLTGRILEAVLIAASRLERCTYLQAESKRPLYI